MSLDDVYRAFAGTRRDITCPAPVPLRHCMVEPLGHAGHVEHHERQTWQGELGPTHEVEMLLAALAEAGRDLGPELVSQVRARLVPLAPQLRSELVTVIDDAFEVAPDLACAHQQVRRLLASSKALEAAKTVWPALPDPVSD